LLALGFGFVEVGTVTPRPQPGNPKPRMFRLPRARSGDQPPGLQQRGRGRAGAQRRTRAPHRRPARHQHRQEQGHAERVGGRRLPALPAKVYPLADYVTVNISSPNTAGLRELQEEQALRRLVSVLRDAQEKLAGQHGKRVPMLVKIAPDLSESDIDAARRVLGDLAGGWRDRHQHHHRPRRRGRRALRRRSGRPVRRAADGQVHRRAAPMLRTRLPESIPLVGVGGILHGADAATKQAAGAHLVQSTPAWSTAARR
jgi:dihydroorotate dehydrogenase